MAFTEMTIDNLNHFLNKLKNFDKYYTYSDDPNQYSRGKKQSEEITEICLNPAFKEIYNVWLEYTDTRHMPLDEEDFYKKVLQISSKYMREEVSSASKEDVLFAPLTPGDLPDPPDTVLESEDYITTRPCGLDALHSNHIFLYNDAAATDYLKTRSEDVSKLYPIIKWRESETPGVVYAYLYACKITKGFTGTGNEHNTIVSREGTMRYITENCLLAYILKIYW